MNYWITRTVAKYGHNLTELTIEFDFQVNELLRDGWTQSNSMRIQQRDGFTIYQQLKKLCNK